MSAALTLASGAGCATSHMRDLPEHIVFGARPDVATVVFVRPSWFAAAVDHILIDESGRFLGESQAQSRFAATLTPGHHTLILWVPAGNTDAVDATLAAGQTYYVEVVPTMVNDRLIAIHPASPEWSELPAWLSSTRPIDADAAAGQASLDKHPTRVRDRVRRGLERIARYTRPEELLEHTLHPTDTAPLPR